MERSDLLIAGCVMYACEGTKKRRDKRRKNGYIYSIEFTNSYPELIAVFSLFLNKIINADWNRVKAQLFIYNELDEDELINYWSKISNINRCNFQKTIMLTSRNSVYKPNPLGTLKIRYSSKNAYLILQKLTMGVWHDLNIESIAVRR